MRREEKLRESMLRYLEGSLPAEEVEKLNQAVEYDWAARREMAELMLQETLLCRVGQESEFFELDVPKAKAERKITARFSTTTRIMRSVDLPVAKPARPRMSGIVAIAAATLFAVSLGVAVKRLQPDVPVMPVEPVITVLPEPPVEEAAKPVLPPAPPPTMKAKAPPPAPAPAVRPPVKSPTVRKPLVPAPTPKTDQGAPLNPAVQDGILIQPAPEFPPPLPAKNPAKK